MHQTPARVSRLRAARWRRWRHTSTASRVEMTRRQTATTVPRRQVVGPLRPAHLAPDQALVPVPVPVQVPVPVPVLVMVMALVWQH